MSSSCPRASLARLPLVLAAAFAAAQALAQQPVTVLPGSTVVATPDELSTENSQSYGSSRTSIGKGNQDIRDIPQSTSVITRQRLDDQNLRSLGEALEQTTGITVQDDNSFQRSYYSRGFQIDSIQYDGVSLDRGASSGFLVQPDLAMYDRVEVLRGATGLMTGNGNPGGTINLVRKRALADRQISGNLSAGSFSNFRGDVDVTDKLNESGSVRVRVVASYTNREYFFREADTEQSLLYGTIDVDLSPATTVSIGASHEKYDLQPFYGGLPRFADGGDLGLARETYLNANWSRTKIDRNSLYGDITHRFNEDWNAKVAATYIREKNHDHSGSVFGTVNRATGRGPTLSAFDGRLTGEQVGVDATLNGKFQAFGLTHDVLIGANYNDREFDNRSHLMTVNNNGIDVFDFDPADYAVFPTVPARAATHTRQKLEQYGAYGSLGMSLSEPLKLILGGRFSHYETEVYNRVQGRRTAQTKDAGIFTPYGALTYTFDSDWTGYASYTEIFTSQANRFDGNGESLDPMTGENYEIGLKGTLLEGRLNAAFAMFRINQENRALVDASLPTDNCPASPVGGACYVGDGKVRSQGFDAEVNGMITPTWMVAAGYTLNNTKYLVDRTAQGTPSANQGAPFSSFTPRHILRLWTSYRLPGELNAWDIGGGVNLNSAAYKTSGAIRIEQGGYAVWSARAGYRINRNLSASLVVNNLFDKTYYRTLGSDRGSNWYGEPRSVMLTLSGRY